MRWRAATGHRGHRPACSTKESAPAFIVCNLAPTDLRVPPRVELARSQIVYERPVFARSRQPELTFRALRQAVPEDT